MSFTPESQAVQQLRDADVALARVIDAVGSVELALSDQRFTALARAIVGQQLSAAAARTIWVRLENLVGGMDVAAIAELDVEAMRAAGLSRAKIVYLQDLAARILEGSIELDQFSRMQDHEVIHYLTQVNGIGRWTAEMFLIFSLGRLDVFALDDAGLRRSICAAFDIQRDVTDSDLVRLTDSWRPYRSVASLYLWDALDRGLLAGP